VIHGLELQGRALCSLVGDTENVSFLVGTQSLRHPNMIYRVLVDEDSLQLSKRQYRHELGEVWQLDSCPGDTNLFTSTFGEKAGPGGWRKASAVLKLPEGIEGIEEDGGEVELVERLDPVLGGGEVSSVNWHPADSTRLVCLAGDAAVLTDLGGGGARAVWRAVHTVRGQTRIETAAWNPHRNNHQVATASGSQVLAWDTRSGEQSWDLHINNNSVAIRSLHFNPNRQYYLLTGGDDGCVSVWDVRSQAECLQSSRPHSHWVWSARYNTYHDQLVLSAGSDSRVVLSSIASLSSEPYGALVDEDTERSQIEDGIISVWLDHEDSVYTAEWSSADPWTFASLSYDGRLVIGHVPSSVKFSILSV